jgi:ABC1 atypical kinase-like domain
LPSERNGIDVTTKHWPDRAEFHALMQNPAQNFVSSAFHQATFATKSGRILAWNGARTIVFRAEIQGQGLMALRFPLTEDHAASTRYQRLEVHLAAHALDTFVPARWLSEGVAMGPAVFPVMTMPWIDGHAINRHVCDVVESPAAKTELENLADSWQRCCRKLVDQHLAHGDIHAGNVMVQRTGTDPPRLMHIDYDSVWVPGLTQASVEVGIPGFQHPGRTLRHWGRDMDAFPNAVMYMSLVALAADPLLWRHNRSDDTMLFDAGAFVDPHGQIWDELRSSTDDRVRSLTERLLQWVAAAPTRFETLDQFLTSGEAVKRGPNPVWGQGPVKQQQQPAAGRATWPPTQPAAGQPAAATAPPVKPAAKANVPLQTWGAKPPAKVGSTPDSASPGTPTPVSPTPASSSTEDSPVGAIIVIIVVVLIILAAMGKL